MIVVIRIYLGAQIYLCGLIINHYKKLYFSVCFDYHYAFISDIDIVYHRIILIINTKTNLKFVAMRIQQNLEKEILNCSLQFYSIS